MSPTTPFVLIVTGGRSYADRDRVFAVLDAIHALRPVCLLVHGACGVDAERPHDRDLRGADRFADEWARERVMPVERVAAAWSRLGPSAGPARNRGMVDLAERRARGRGLRMLAFPGGRGTESALAAARARGVPVFRDDAALEAGAVAALVIANPCTWCEGAGCETCGEVTCSS